MVVPGVEFMLFVTLDQFPVPVISVYVSFSKAPVPLSKLNM